MFGGPPDADVEFEGRFRTHRQAVADITHVDAAILRRRPRIDEGELHVPAARDHVAQCDPNGAAGAFSVERDGGYRPVVGKDFEAAPGIVGADVVEFEHQGGEAQVGTLGHRNEYLPTPAKVGKPKSARISDVAEQNPECERFHRRGVRDGARIRPGGDRLRRRRHRSRRHHPGERGLSCLGVCRRRQRNPQGCGEQEAQGNGDHRDNS